MANDLLICESDKRTKNILLCVHLCDSTALPPLMNIKTQALERRQGKHVISIPEGRAQKTILGVTQNCVPDFFAKL
ncbi:unnamed protein product [Heligmosomoides polygyrus]|uniref:Uncharacterized protein n=1 Tax=Heligmosomoides polygyrus TaxID=6339 RepID=A0A183GD75_HELPZ|nr:unnamed protein product [Heligmosomoides polygyrus]